MSNRLPTVTIIIPARPGESQISALDALRALDYPPERLGIIVARGRQPSVQRNTALKAAQGELIYFLDDDARPAPQTLRRAVGHFTDPAVKMVGGPNLCPATAPWIEQLFAVVLGSWLAFGPSRARYAKVGRVRSSSEKELILCNLAARRDTIIELGGFDESLYPNEENALMDEIQTRHGKLLYDPEVIVERRPRPTLMAFARMLSTYGRGRAEQFRLHPTFGSALNFVPPLFCLYLLLPIILAVSGLEQWAKLSAYPLVVYSLCVIAQALVAIPSHGVGRSLASMPLVIMSHVLYGLGFWCGLFTAVRGKSSGQRVDVVLEHIKL